MLPAHAGMVLRPADRHSRPCSAAVVAAGANGMGGAPPVGVRGTLATTPSPSKVTIEFVDGCVGRYSPPSHLIKLRKRRKWSRKMDRSPRPLLDLATFVLLMFAVAVGGGSSTVSASRRRCGRRRSAVGQICPGARDVT